MKAILAISLALTFIDCTNGFIAGRRKARHHQQHSLLRRHHLFGIAEWRDTDFDVAISRPLGAEQGGGLPKSVCLLPFAHEEVLLQGETKQLRLYEDRFIKLFDDAIQNHSGVVAMGLLANAGIIQTVPLCEIESYARMDGFGIFVTIRCVGRAQLVEIKQTDPYLKAVCTELSDKLPPNMDLPNLLASNIEELSLWLTSSERRLDQARGEKGSSQTNGDEEDDDEEDAEMQRRINIAKLEDRFYSEPSSIEDDEDDDDDEADDAESDRLQRFRTAYQVALETDTQGYQLSNQNAGDRTPQELTAIGWAAFCTEILPEQDAMFRVQALDMDNLFDRLKLAVIMLREKKKKLVMQIEKAGLKGSDFDEDACA
ncbi:hypothetical protein MPSEU_000385500 [Mayamaea pseudoterrestris]|nr:hypothetical protein MPSEU_000385500 [Mayamaea pseudoterrestris]